MRHYYIAVINLVSIFYCGQKVLGLMLLQCTEADRGTYDNVGWGGGGGGIEFKPGIMDKNYIQK